MTSDCTKSDWKGLLFNVCKQGNLQNQVQDLSFYQTLHQNFKNQQNELYQAKNDNKNLLQSLRGAHFSSILWSPSRDTGF